MKSITKKLSLLALLSAVLFLSSCLDSGSNTHIGKNEFSYIDESNFGTIIYARTSSGAYITSPKISSEFLPGDVALLSYELSDDNEIIRTNDNLLIYKVDLTEEPRKLEQEHLQLIPAPENEKIVYFENIIAPPTWFTNSSLHFGDRWPLTIQYKAGKEDKATISFYLVDERNLPEDFDGDILIDIRLEISGKPETGIQKELKMVETIVNLSDIRTMYSGNEPSDPNNNIETKDLKIKFRFFRSANEGELHISREPVLMRVIK